MVGIKYVLLLFAATAYKFPQFAYLEGTPLNKVNLETFIKTSLESRK